MGKKTATSASKTSSKNADSASAEKKKKRKVSPKGARNKGLSFERQIANELGHIFPGAQRMLEYQGSNVIGVDLENTDVFRFQCKCHANYKNPSTIFEIRETKPHVPVLVTKANNRPPMAVLPFKEFVTLLEMAYGHRERLINPYVKEQGPGALAQVESYPSTVISLPPTKGENFLTASEVEARWKERGEMFQEALLETCRPLIEAAYEVVTKKETAIAEAEQLQLSSFL